MITWYMSHHLGHTHNLLLHHPIMGDVRVGNY